MTEALGDELEATVAAGRCRSAHVAIVERVAIIADVAVGIDHLDRPANQDAMFAVYCCTKPAVAAGVLALVDDGELSLDDRLGDVVQLELPGWLADLLIKDLLLNRAGLHDVSWLLARVLPEAHRTPWVLATPAPPGFEIGVDLGYAAYGPWHLLGLAIEALTGCSYDRFVTDRIFRRYGLEPDDLALRPSGLQFDHIAPRIAVAWGGDRGTIPMLAEAGFETAAEWNPGFGGYATVRGLAHLADRLVGDTDGAARALTARSAGSMTGSVVRGDDCTLRRTVAYGHGTLTELGRYGMAEVPPDTFGVTAEGGLAGMVASPQSGRAVAWRFDRMSTDDLAGDVRRAGLLTRCFM